MALLWRVVFGWLLLRLLRWGVRWVPRLALGGAALAVWPAVAGAYGLRRWGLPWATDRAAARWPSRAGWAPRGLAAAAALLALAFVLSPPAWRAAVPPLLVAGWLAPLAVPLGVPPGLALAAVAAALPLWAGLGVVLAAGWPAYGRLVRGFLRPPVLKPDGRSGAGDRRSEKPGHQEGPLPVALKPVPTQQIATRTFKENAWTVKPLYGPGLLSMIVAPPGVGKTELAYGSLAAAVDGLAFCGWETHRPKRVLLLSEMEPKTIQPALLRWGFVVAPTSTLHRLRLRWLRPDGSPGHLIDVVHASDAYAPDAETGRRPSWADVIRATVPVLERGRYDLLLVDSLARWMGNDSSNAAMLDALGALRQVTRMGVGVLAPHHCAKDASPPYEPRGGSAILGELDLCWSLARLPGCADPLHDPRRVLECVKSRFAELTPPPLRIERVDVDPDAPRPRYGYRLLDGAKSEQVVPTSGDAGTNGSDPLSDQQRRVLAALVGAPDHEATTPELMAVTGLENNRVKEATLALIRGGWVVVAGAGRPSPRGGRPPTRYRATPLALAQPVRNLTPGPESPEGGDPEPVRNLTPNPADRLLRQALDHA